MIFQLKILTPEGIVAASKVRYANFPGMEGRFGVLPRHTDLVVQLSAGVLELEDDMGLILKYSIGSGVAEVRNHSVVVLVNSAQQLSE